MYYPFKNGSLENIVGTQVATNTDAIYTKSLGKESFYFNGSTSFISAPFTNSVTTELSMFAWVYLNAYTSDRSCILIKTAYLTVNSIGKVSIYNAGKSPSGYHDSNTTIELNKWYHIGVTWNTTEAKIYINGVLDRTISCSGNPTIGTPIDVGSEYGSTRKLNGYITDARIYNNILTITEINQLYTTSNPQTKIDLIAHYPLNGNTDDYSAYGNNVTNSGAVIDNNGKIGKCYSFDGAQMTTTIPFSSYDPALTNSTMSCWLYIKNLTSFIPTIPFTTTANTATENIIGYNSYGGLAISLWYTEAGLLSLYFSYRSSISSAYVIYNNVLTEKWYHLTGVVENDIIKFYINGILIGTSNISTIKNVWTDTRNFSISLPRVWSNSGPAVNFPTKINDVRLYNTAISEKEIKELAKAKILHYNFNDYQEPTINLDNPTQMLNPMGHGLTYNYLGLDNGWQKYSISGTKPVGDNYPYTFNINCTKNLLSGNKQSMRFKMKCNCLEKYGQVLTGTVVNIVWDSVTITYLPSTPNKSNIIYDYLVENLSHHEVIPQTQPFYLYSSGIEGVSFNPATDFIWLKDHQIEDKDHSTNYTPTTRTGQVHDSSGYDNHADLTLSETPQYTSLSKLGTGGYYWLDTTKKIEKTINRPSEKITMNCWFKGSTQGGSGYNIPMSINGGEYEMSITPSGKLRCGFYLSGNRYVYDWGSGLLDGNWHMLTTQYDGAYIRGFIDSEEVGNTNIVGNLPTNSGILRIGSYDGSTTYGNINAYEDDIRIYATALSLNDIKKLYQVGQFTHNNGSLETNQFIENGYGHTLVNYNKWVVGDFVYQDGWNNHWGGKPTQYSDLIALYSNPQGEQDIVYESKVLDNTFVNYRTRGLAATPTILPDITKTYRLSCWVYISGNTTSGTSWYAGLDYSKVCDINTTTPNGNPYHHVLSGGVSTGDKWILCVSYIYPYGSIGNVNNAKRYLPDGTIHSTGTDYNWNSGISSFFLRWLFNYQYDQPNVNQYTLLYRPRFDLIDGTEPTLQELLKCQDHKPLPLTKPEFNANHSIDINEIREAFVPGITFVKDDNNNTQKLICDYFNGETFAKANSGSFVMNGVTFNTTYQKINPSDYNSKVIMNMSKDILYINKIIEN